MALVHHELCFGCGRTNLFGLLLEAERQPDGSVQGRCFVKQDHQGPRRGYAHPGIIATALSEAMSLACGPDANPHAVTVGYLEEEVPVGAFLTVRAAIVEATADALTASAEASTDTATVAKARGTYANARS